MKQDILDKYVPGRFRIRKEGNVAVYNVLFDELPGVADQLYFTHSLQLKTITAMDERSESGGFRIYYLFGVPKENIFLAPCITLTDREEFPSITKAIHEASGYERKIGTFFGLKPARHPHPRPIILHENWPGTSFPLRKDFEWRHRPAEAHGSYEFRKVEGKGIYEIPVGPVHAGIIEPGHFRFNVLGEEIVSLEPKLGYKHKGTEKLFEVLPVAGKVRLSERVSGDTSFTHSLAFCQAVENLAGIAVPERAKYLRVVFSEMERLANHLNDIGFIMLDAGYNFGGSSGARLREIVMQSCERIAGNRFLRGINTVGGVTRDITGETGAELLNTLKKVHDDFNDVIEIAEGSFSLSNRLSGTGKLERQIALDHGAIGVTGRAIGIAHDARVEYPYAAYDKLKFEIALEEEGDVRARWLVRVKEVHSSLNIIEQALLGIPLGDELISGNVTALRKHSYGVGVAEGWRGDIVYFIATDAEGEISRVDVRDPSFINWTVLGYAGKGNVVPDFPLINKSFNLSYSGNDL
ncbi:MAG TPA: NADH-quinone oxidoreductase subunit C [Thermodesulfobacteriota bacterium]|nr:NADH-quinone oxidoreductase subunit C [Thermodesulfobacteriota bacterium]